MLFSVYDFIKHQHRRAVSRQQTATHAQRRLQPVVMWWIA